MPVSVSKPGVIVSSVSIYGMIPDRMEIPYDADMGPFAQWQLITCHNIAGHPNGLKAATENLDEIEQTRPVQPRSPEA